MKDTRAPVEAQGEYLLTVGRGRALGARHVRHTPSPDRFEHRSKRPSVRGEVVTSGQARLGGGRSADQSFAFQLPQLLTENFGGDPRHRSAQLTEAETAAVEPLEDHRLPAPVDGPEGGVQRAAVAFAAGDGAF